MVMCMGEAGKEGGGGGGGGGHDQQVIQICPLFLPAHLLVHADISQDVTHQRRETHEVLIFPDHPTQWFHEMQASIECDNTKKGL